MACYHEPKHVSVRWRDSRQISGVRARAVAAYNACSDGATASVELKTLRNLIDICDQAAWTEKGHGK